MLGTRWIIPRFLEKKRLAIFASVLIAFVEVRIYKGPYLSRLMS